jgi:hypothetical protein
MRIVRRGVVSTVVCCAAWVGVAQPAAADKPATESCSPGFDLGAVSSADYLELPRTAAAIDAGLVDEAFILAGFAGFDKNANDMVCVQLSNGFETNNRPFGEYLYNVTDDTARAR